jgi:ribosomal protein S15P/S13E
MITQEGEQLKKEKVRSLLLTNPRIASPFDPGIIHLSLLFGEETIACLQERIRALDHAIEQIKAHHNRRGKSEKPCFARQISDRVLAYLYTEKIRVEKFIEEVDQHVRTGTE